MLIVPTTTLGFNTHSMRLDLFPVLRINHARIDSSSMQRHPESQAQKPPMVSIKQSWCIADVWVVRRRKSGQLCRSHAWVTSCKACLVVCYFSSVSFLSFIQSFWLFIVFFPPFQSLPVGRGPTRYLLHTKAPRMPQHTQLRYLGDKPHERHIMGYIRE